MSDLIDNLRGWASSVMLRAWGQYIEASGGIFVVARSIADVESALGAL